MNTIIFNVVLIFVSRKFLIMRIFLDTILRECTMFKVLY